MNDSTDNTPTFQPIQLFEEDFNLEIECAYLEFTDIPDTEDIEFDFINMDSSDLTRAKKTKFWDFLVNNLGVHLRYGEKLTIDKLISYYPSYEEPLFHLKNNLHFSIEQCYGWILKYCGIDGASSKTKDKKIKKLQSVCMDKGGQVVDEVYLILIKMLRNNPEEETVIRVWEIIAYMASYCLPSANFLYPVYNYLLTVIEHHPEAESKSWARYTLKRLYRLVIFYTIYSY